MPDSLGLATSSLGFEARLHLRAQRFSEAIDLYPGTGHRRRAFGVQFLAVGRFASFAPWQQRSGTIGIPSPRAKGGDRLRHRRGLAIVPIDIDSPLKEAVLLLEEKAAAKSTLLPTPKPSWHSTKAPVLIWLDAVERANVKDVDLRAAGVGSVSGRTNGNRPPLAGASANHPDG